MKTPEQILEQEGLTLPILTKDQTLKAMQFYADQFKSPSPVSQQLTRERAKELLQEKDWLCSDFFSSKGHLKNGIKTEEMIEFLSHLSVSPDAQKEIDELNRKIEELNRQILSQRIEQGETKPFTVAYKRSLEKMVTQGEISYSRMIELMNEKAFHFSSEQLTSKESDVKMAVEALYLAKAEIKSCYNKLGYKGSSVIQKIDEALKGNK